MIVTCKCLATLYVLITWPIATPIGSAPASRPARTRTMIGASSFSVAASRASWVRARSAASTGVAAGDQPLAGVVRLGDLGQVLPVEQAYLQRPAAGGQPLDRRTPSAVTRAAADDRQPAGRDPAGAGMALAAGPALEQLTDDDSGSVAASATTALDGQALPELALPVTVIDFGPLPQHGQFPERRIRIGNAGGGAPQYARSHLGDLA